MKNLILRRLCCRRPISQLVNSDPFFSVCFGSNANATVVSLPLFWTITLVPLFKYVFIVLRADDNGEGGTFAFYSLLCRHARVNSLPSCQLADEQLIEYKTDSIGSSSAIPQSGFAASLKSTLEKHRVLQKMLLVLVLIGTCMVIGDGVLTPAISVFFCSIRCGAFNGQGASQIWPRSITNNPIENAPIGGIGGLSTILKPKSFASLSTSSHHSSLSAFDLVFV